MLSAHRLATRSPCLSALAAAGLVLLGLPMGMPFPLAVRALAQMGRQGEVPWLWGVNGAASVFGSVFAVSLSVASGYTAALIAGGVAYLAAAVYWARTVRNL